MHSCGVKKSFLILFVLSSISSCCLYADDIMDIKKSSASEKAEAALQTALIKQMEKIKDYNYSEIVEIGIKNGVMSGAQGVVALSIQAVAAPVVEEVAKPVGACFKYPIKLINKCLQNTIFGSRRLGWNGVARLNNTLYELIQPLTQQSLGDFTKERRAELVAAKSNSEMLIDKDWQLRKDRLVAELDYVINEIGKKMACYESAGEQNAFRKAMQGLYCMFSVEQREEMAQYLHNAKQYCEDIKELLSDIQAIKQLEEHRDLMKFLLARALRSFKMVLMFIDEEAASMPAGSHRKGYAKLQELNAQGNGSLAGLDELFGGNGGGASAA